tara:strand:+ start:382 stop:762 length:381 start_codon:yes stop_codon:yes gene_type:complete
MNFKIATKKYAVDNIFDFRGRASRWEYWGGSLLFSFISFFTDIIVETTTSLTTLLLIIIFYIWGIIAGLTCSIRRLHDVGKSGWTLLWTLTIIGIFYLLYLDVQPSQQNKNLWGDPPEHTIETNEI